MSTIPIEDNFNDVIGKTQRGLKISDADLVSRAGITPAELASAKNGTPDDAVLRALAPALSLDGTALVALAHHSWYPTTPAFDDGFALFNTPFDIDMTVNNYLVWDAATREAAVFDTGTDIAALLGAIQQKELRVRSIFITHTHPDHIARLAELANATGAVVYTHPLEPVPLPGAQTFAEGATFARGGLSIKTRETGGHSPGMTTYVVGGLSQPLAVVGDAIFSGSMGGSVEHFLTQRRNNAEKIMTLPEATVLAPGHGPLTTVGWEKMHNPFFAPGADPV